MKRSGKIAMSGMMGALSLILLLASVVPTATMAIPAMAGLVLTPVFMEAGVKWGWLVYAAVGLLNLFITPEPEAAVLFVAFFGYYPVLRISLGRLPVWLSWAAKLAVLNTTMVGAYWVMMRLMGLDSTEFEFFGMNIPLVLLAIGNGVFIIYDLAIGNVNYMYMRFLHPHLLKIFK